jgi:3'-5' exoribonuclease
MATAMTSQVIRLGEFQDGVEAECFAVLVSREMARSKRDEPFVRCNFGDRELKLEAMLWHDNRFREQAAGWIVGEGYRLKARGKLNGRYGMQLEILDIRRATPELDGEDGYDFHELVERSKFPPGFCLGKIRGMLDTYMRDEKLKALVTRIIDANQDLLERMPAATLMHHGFTGGLVEHVWSVTRVALTLANHYEWYYSELDPPLNKDVILAGAVLHDIGKLRELQYHPVEARYTTLGTLIGHIQMGRDMVRETAREIGGICEETLMLLEHAILAHHGRREYGSPVEPSTLEALILSYADELDAKVNSVTQAIRRAPVGDNAFTDKVFAVNNRKFYRGMPVPPPIEPEPGIEPPV